MFKSIRSRIASLIAATAGLFNVALADTVEAMPAPINVGQVAPPPPAKEMYVSRPFRSSRVPHSNRDERRRRGIPHGTSGAKLARKALNGTIGK